MELTTLDLGDNVLGEASEVAKGVAGGNAYHHWLDKTFLG